MNPYTLIQAHSLASSAVRMLDTSRPYGETDAPGDRAAALAMLLTRVVELFDNTDSPLGRDAKAALDALGSAS